jgi:RHS repeat-associated protein
MGATTYSYDRADWITAAGGTAYTVDAAGNVTARGSDTFTFDQANRLHSATAGGVSAAYVYDGDGNRSSKTVGAETTSYVYDQARGLPALLEDGSRTYVWAHGLAYTTDTAGALESAVHQDALSSVRALTSSSGTLTDTIQRDAFGSPIEVQGQSDQPFGFTGEQRDAESGFIYLRARMYDPTTGRLISRDPLGGLASRSQSQNRYAYAGNNPVNFRDPSGHALTAGEEGGACVDPACVDNSAGGYVPYNETTQQAAAGALPTTYGANQTSGSQAAAQNPAQQAAYGIAGTFANLDSPDLGTQLIALAKVSAAGVAIAIPIGVAITPLVIAAPGVAVGGGTVAAGTAPKMPAIAQESQKIAELIEPSRRWPGGISVEVVLRDAETGAIGVIHYVERAGQYLHEPHIRPYVTWEWTP